LPPPRSQPNIPLSLPGHKFQPNRIVIAWRTVQQFFLESSMTDVERELRRRIERLETEVHLLGSIAGIMLSIIGQLGYRNVEEAVLRGLTDAAASVPARNEADWDEFVAYIRKQGMAVTVQRVVAGTDPARPGGGVTRTNR
jgi:hypothetical protein